METSITASLQMDEFTIEHYSEIEQAILDTQYRQVISGMSIAPMVSDPSFIIKELLGFGLGKIPYVGSILSGLLKAFWPEKQKDVFEEIKEQIEALISEQIAEAYWHDLQAELNRKNIQIEEILTRLEDKNPQAKDDYVQLSFDFVGFEEKFKRPNEAYYVLPLFCAVVTLQITFYLEGINKGIEFGLNNNQIQDCKNRVTALLYGRSVLSSEVTLNVSTSPIGAIEYVKTITEKAFDTTYDELEGSNAFNPLANVTTYNNINGLEFIPIWETRGKEPTNPGKEVYIDKVSFSEYFGRQTSTIVNWTKLQKPPLTPKLISGKRNQLKTVELYEISIGGPMRICGAILYWADGEKDTMGSINNNRKIIELQNAQISSLEVWGGGAIDLITIFLSDGRKLTAGTIGNIKKSQTFSLNSHNISSFILTDSPGGQLAGQAACLAVSYIFQPSGI